MFFQGHEFDAKKWLQALNLRVIKEVTAKSIEETLQAAKKIGYPIVLKGITEGQVHKTELGLVKLNLKLLISSNQLAEKCSVPK